MREPLALVISPIIGTFVVYLLMAKIRVPFWIEEPIDMLLPSIPWYLVAVTLTIFLPIHLWLKGHKRTGMIPYIGSSALAAALPTLMLGSFRAAALALPAFAVGAISGALFWLFAVRPQTHAPKEHAM
jgi:hypothetical protein